MRDLPCCSADGPSCPTVESPCVEKLWRAVVTPPDAVFVIRLSGSRRLCWPPSGRDRFADEAGGWFSSALRFVSMASDREHRENQHFDYADNSQHQRHHRQTRRPDTSR